MRTLYTAPSDFGSIKVKCVAQPKCRLVDAIAFISLTFCSIFVVYLASSRNVTAIPRSFSSFFIFPPAFPSHLFCM